MVQKIATGVIGGSFTINDVTVYAHASPEPGKNFLGDWKSSATGLTNNVLYKNVDGLVFKGIDINTYDSKGLCILKHKHSYTTPFNRFFHKNRYFRL